MPRYRTASLGSTGVSAARWPVRRLETSIGGCSGLPGRKPVSVVLELDLVALQWTPW